MLSISSSLQKETDLSKKSAENLTSMFNAPYWLGDALEDDVAFPKEVVLKVSIGDCLVSFRRKQLQRRSLGENHNFFYELGYPSRGEIIKLNFKDRKTLYH